MMKKDSVFAALVIEKTSTDPIGDFEVYLVNTGDKDYSRVTVHTGGHLTYGEKLVETARVTKEKGALGPHSFCLLDRSDLDELYETSIWYVLDLHLSSGGVESYTLGLPKSARGYSEEATVLPVLDKKGLRLELEPAKGLRA
jgi:hypothetical protein